MVYQTLVYLLIQGSAEAALLEAFQDLKTVAEVNSSPAVKSQVCQTPPVFGFITL